MYGHNRNSGIHKITRYAEALRTVNETRPIAGKGANAGIRPLGHRRLPQYQIRMRQDESIACRLWRTDVVVFDKDGTITIDPDGYSTISTANFISEVLGIAAYQFNHRLVVGINGKQYEADKLKLRYDEKAWCYVVVECGRDVVHNLDRKKMNALRKDTQEFRKFLHGLMKIKDYQLTDEEIAEVNLRENGQIHLAVWRHNTSDVVARLNKFVDLIKSEDAGNWHSAAMWLCASARYSQWTKTLSPDLVLKRLDDVLIALNTDVLVPKELPTGVVKVDAYSRFKPFLEVV